jgi:hypothetical protein
VSAVECVECGRIFHLRYVRPDAYCSEACKAAAEQTAEDEEASDG